MCSVQCALSNVLCPMCSVQCARPMCSVQCALSNMLCQMCSLECILSFECGPFGHWRSSELSSELFHVIGVQCSRCSRCNSLQNVAYPTWSERSLSTVDKQIKLAKPYQRRQTILDRPYQNNHTRKTITERPWWTNHIERETTTFRTYYKDHTN